jgi:hypothetical protein
MAALAGILNHHATAAQALTGTTANPMAAAASSQFKQHQQFSVHHFGQ